MDGGYTFHHRWDYEELTKLCFKAKKKADYCSVCVDHRKISIFTNKYIYKVQFHKYVFSVTQDRVFIIMASFVLPN